MKRGFKIILGIVLLILVVAVIVKRTIYKRAPAKTAVATQQSVAAESPLVSRLVKSVFMDFESRSALETENHVTSEKASVKGGHSIHLDENSEYGDPLVAPLENILKDGRLTRVVLHFKIFSASKLKQVRFVVAVGKREGKDAYWSACDLDKKSYKWDEQTCEFQLNPDDFKKDNLVKIYLWNAEKSDFYIDDLRMDFYGPSKSQGEMAESAIQKQSNFSFDFEGDSIPYTSDAVAYEGKKSYKIGRENEYGPGVTRKAGEFSNDTIRSVSISVMIYPLSDNPDLVLVSTIQDASGKRLDWQGKTTKNFRFEKNKWKKLSAKFMLADTAKASGDVEVGAYIWDKGKDKAHIDNLEITFGDNKPRLGEGEPVNMLSDDVKEYKPERNKPPYRIAFLNITEQIRDIPYQNIENKNKTQFPFRDDLTSVFFKGIDNSIRAISVNSSHKIDLLSYCNDKKQFFYAGTFPGITLKESDQVISGNFLNRNQGDIIVIHKAEKKVSILKTGILKSSCNSCTENNCLNATISSISLEDFVTDLSADYRVACGNLQGSGTEDVLMIDSKGSYSAFKFNGDNKVSLVAKGSIELKPGSKIITLCFSNVISKSKDDLLIIQKDSAETSIEAFVYSNQKLKLQKFPDHSINSLLSGQSKLIRIKNGDSKDELLLYNHSWRFDLKKLNLDQKGFFVESNIDFKGYESDHNPKYYESVSMLPFQTGKNGESLLLILRNCADKNYKGSACINYENLDYLPNKMEIYDFH